MNAPSHIAKTEASIAAAFASAAPVYLSFSGGKESLALLKLCEPYEGRFKLLWANTGFIFPHVEKMIRELGERFGLVEVRGDLKRQWEVHGWPSNMLTVESFASHKSSIRLQPWLLCCAAMKSAPVEAYFATHQGPAVVLHGQRQDDGWKFGSTSAGGRVTVVAPLLDWTTDDVFAFIEAEGIELPEHYSTIKDSLDCWLCPSHWTHHYAPEFGEYIRARYPELAEKVLPVAREIHAELNSVMAKAATALDAGSIISGGVGATSPRSNEFIAPITQGERNVRPDVGQHVIGNGAHDDEDRQHPGSPVGELAKGRVVLGRSEVVGHGHNVMPNEGVR